MPKPTKIPREDFLHRLESIVAGTTKRGIIEQSDCFAFKDGKIMTFNGEIFCRSESSLPIDFTGAVHSQGLLNILRKMDENEITISVSESELIIDGKNCQAGIRMESAVTLPVDQVERPKEWKKLHEDFTQGVSIVQECAGKDETMFVTTCVRIHPKYLEACDRYQMARFQVKNPIQQPFLVRKESIKHIVNLDMTSIAETDAWVHFKNPAGIRLSCSRLVGEEKGFKDLDTVFNDKPGTRTYLPKQLEKAADQAETFSAENQDSNYLIAKLQDGRLQLKGQGVSGWFKKVIKVKYKGDPLTFLIGPKILMELTKHSSECFIKPGTLRVNGEKFIYLAKLGTQEK